jgi:WD40 repeat protein
MWDLQGQIQLAKPSQMRNPRDPVTCAVWLTGKNDVQETLCCGTGLGYLIIWKQRPNTTTEFDEILSRRIGSGQEIMHITCDTRDTSGGTRFITGTRDKRVQVWSLDSRHQFSNVFSIELSTTVPRASFFHGTDVIVCGMYDGEM